MRQFFKGIRKVLVLALCSALLLFTYKFSKIAGDVFLQYVAGQLNVGIRYDNNSGLIPCFLLRDITLERPVITISDGITLEFDEAYIRPDFSGILFDSSFSLSNTGETVSIRNQDLVDEDTASYTSDMGAKGDGNSLQKINGSWVSAFPTIGVSEISSSPVVVKESVSAGVWIVDESQIYANAGEDKIVIVGADTLFEGKALGIKKEPLEDARFLWNFGDGSVKEGNSVLHNFRYPGEYVVFLDVSSGAYSSSDRILVKAEPSNLTISSLRYGNGSYIEIHNASDKELDISFWRLRSGNNHFVIPQNTYILSNKKIIFSENITGLKVFHGIGTSLLYPNGEVAYTYVNVVAPIVQSVTEDEKIEIIPETVENDVQDTALSAAVSMVDDDNTPLYKWFTALAGLVSLSAGGLLFLRSKEVLDSDVD